MSGDQHALRELEEGFRGETPFGVRPLLAYSVEKLWGLFKDLIFGQVLTTIRAKFSRS